MKTLNITNKEFSIENLETYLSKNCLPGKYHINWYVGKTIYEIELKWTGKEFIDLHEQ